MTLIRTSPCRDGPAPRRRWKFRVPRRGEPRTSTTTWRWIQRRRRFEVESQLGVALSEIKLKLCDAVLLVMIVEMMMMFMILMILTNKLHLHFREEGKRWESHLEPTEDDRHSDWFDHTAELNSFTRGSGLIFRFCGLRDAFEVDNDHSLPGAAGVECSMARKWWNTDILSISPDFYADFCSTIK